MTLSGCVTGSSEVSISIDILLRSLTHDWLEYSIVTILTMADNTDEVACFSNDDNDDEEETFRMKMRRAEALARARRKAMESSDEDDEEDDGDDSPATNTTTSSKDSNRTPTSSITFDNHCSQPSWSQEHFMELMRRQIPEDQFMQLMRKATTTTTGGTTTNIYAQQAHIYETASPEMTQLEKETLPFTPRVDDQAYNLRMYQDFLRSQMSKTSTSTTSSKASKTGSSSNGTCGTMQSVVEQAEVAVGMRDKPCKRKMKRQAAAEAKKKARDEKAKRRADEKAAKEAEAERLVTVRTEIDALLDKFQSDHYACIEVHEEKKPKTGGGVNDDTDYAVAKWFVTRRGKPNEKRYDFLDFNHQQLRKLAGKCGIKAYGTLSTWNCRVQIAAFVRAGTMYKEHGIANPFTTGQEKRLNTYMRIVNVCFLPNMVQRFVDLNDSKKRQDFESSGGGDPIKSFFVEASNTCNDPSMNHILSRIAGAEEDGDPHLYDWTAAGDFNLNDFDPQTYLTCQSKAYDLLKSRELALAGMRKSGTHDSDFWNFCSNPHYLKWRSAGQPIPAQAVYYCHQYCLQYPAIDGKFADKLAENMKSDSNIPMSGEAGQHSSYRDRKLTKGEKELMAKMENVLQQQKESAERTYKQREEYIDLQKEESAKTSERETWKEYLLLSKDFKAMKSENDPDNICMLRNLAKRLRKLEIALNIDVADTITGGFLAE